MPVAKSARPGAARRPVSFTPMQIARHRLLTAREKLDLLARLRVQMSGRVGGGGIGFGAAEVDRAIDDVYRVVETGQTPAAKLPGRP